MSPKKKGALTRRPKPEADVRAEERARLKVRHDADIRSIRATVTELKAQVKEQAKELEKRERELNTYAASLRRRAAPKPIKPQKRGSHHSESVLLALASDWHIEEEVRPSEVGGRNKYNLDIAKKRAERFFQSLVKLARIHREHTQLDTLVLWLGGDFITGHIHEELMAASTLTPLQAIDIAADMIQRGLEFLVEHGGFKRIVCPCSFGNHGRLTKRAYYTRAAHTNLEWAMYLRLQEKLGERVEFLVTEARRHEELVVFGRRLRFHHGEDLRYAGGMQGLYGRLHKQHKAWNAAGVGHECYLTCVGHWHTANAFQDLGLTNGSLIGPSAYSLLFETGFEPARQMFTLIEKERGMTAAGPVFVE